uniref:Fibronectin type-III domain-containing protein n=1 Tax=Megaselia scalaris TaxID=36166 RepID=T1GVB6_MEGSC
MMTFLWRIFDPQRTHSIFLIEIKEVLLILCKVSSIQHLTSEMFALVCNQNRCISLPRLQLLLAIFIKFLVEIGEESAYGSHNIPEIMNQCHSLYPGVLGIDEYQFQCLWSGKQTRFLIYANLLALVKRMNDTEKLIHKTQCFGCHTERIIGIRFKCKKCTLKDDRCYCDSEISENDKLSYTLCPIRCSKNKSQYCGGVDAMSYYVMNGKRVGNFPKIINRTETSLTIEWDYIRRKHGITEYTIKADILKTYAKESFYSPPEFVVASDQDRYEISNLHPGTEYNITLTAKCGAEVCDSVSIKDETLIENTHIHVSLGLVSERFDIVRIRYGPASHDHDTVEDFQNFKFADFEEGQNSIIALSVACVILAYDAQSSSRTLDFRSELNKIIDNLDRSQRYPRNAIRLNVNTILADGEFGEVVSGTLYTDSGAIESQVHVISDDMEKKSQYTFLQDFQNLIRVMPHEKFVNFLGVSASPDWFYLLFENKHTSLKNFLLDSRNNLVLHEGVILQIIYDISSAMEYLEKIIR